MKILDLHAVDGQPVAVAADQIVLVEDYPAGQCTITLAGEPPLQVQEDPAEVTRMWKESER